MLARNVNRFWKHGKVNTSIDPIQFEGWASVLLDSRPSRSLIVQLFISIWQRALLCQLSQASYQFSGLIFKKMSILSRASFRILKLLSTFPRMKQECLQKKLGVKVCAFLMLKIIGSQAGVMVEGKLMVCKIKCWWARGHVKTTVKEQSEEMKGCDGRVDAEWRGPPLIFCIQRGLSGLQNSAFLLTHFFCF